MLLSAALSAGPAAADDIILNPGSAYPEGPAIVSGDLYYAEMGADRVMRHGGGGNAVVWTRPGCGPTSVAPAPDGALYVLCHLEDAVVVIDPSGGTIAVIDRDEAGHGFATPNASVSDGAGGIYFSSSGDFSPAADARGAVMHLEASGRLRRLAEDIRYANGVTLSPDGAILYVSEHLARRVLAFDVAGDGSLSGRRVFVSLDDLVAPDPGRIWEAGPDGLATDSAGNLYMAEYGGGRLLVVGPDGALLAEIPVPEQFVTAPVLSADGKTIYVTAPSTRYRPYDGTVRAIANPVAGG